MLGETLTTNTILLAFGLAGLLVLLFEVVKKNIYIRSFLGITGLGIVLSVWITAFVNYFFNRTLDIDWSFLGISRYTGVYVTGIVVSIFLFVLCYFRIWLVFLRENSLTITRLLELFWSIIFCSSYAITYILFVGQHQSVLVIETLIGVSVIGLIGAIIPNKRFTAALLLPQVQKFSTQVEKNIRLGIKWAKKEWKVLIYSATCLTSLSLAFFPYSNSQNVNYQVLYKDKETVVSKPVASIDNYSNLSGYYQEKGNILKALEYSDKFLSISPSDAQERLKRANLFTSIGEDGQAIQEFKKAVELNPSLTDSYFGLILLYEKTGLYADAIDSVEQVIHLLHDEQKQQLLMVQASLFLKTGEYELAGNTLSQVGPELSKETSLMKGIASLGQGDIEGAKVAFNHDRESYLASWIFQNSGAIYNSAIGYDVYLNINSVGADSWTSWLITNKPIINTLTMTSPSSTNLFYDVKEHFLSSKYQTPILEAIVLKDPKAGNVAYKALGDFSYDQGLKKEALSYLDKAFLAARSDEKLQQSLMGDAIKIAKELNDNALLESYYQRYLKLAQNQPQNGTDDIAQVYYNLGNLKVGEGKTPEAINDYSEAIKYKQDYKEAYLARGQAYAKLDRFDQALSDMNMAFQIDPTWVDPKIFSGYYLSRQQKIDEATTIFASIENQSKGNALYFHYLGYLRVMQGNRDLALSMYEKCFQLLQTNYFSSSSLTDKYQEISDELNALLSKELDKTAMVNDIFLLMRGSMSSNTKTIASNYFFSSASSSLAASPTTSSSTQSVVSPTKKTLWLQISVVGPEKISPGSSNIVEILAELKNSPDSSGTAFPLEVLDTHQYAMHINLQTVSFDINDPKKSYDLKLGEPVHWQFIVSPKPDYEGEQKIAYDIVVEDKDSSVSEYPKDISVSTIAINVPTKYGIPPNLLYPTSGLLAGIAAISALPVWNYLKSYLDKKSRQKKTSRRNPRAPRKKADQIPVKSDLSESPTDNEQQS